MSKTDTMTSLPDWSSLKHELTVQGDLHVWKSQQAPHQLYYTSDSAAKSLNSTLRQKELEYSYARGQRLQHPNILVPRKLAKEYRSDFTRCYLQLDVSAEARNRFAVDKIPGLRFLTPLEPVRELSWAYHLMLALAYLHDREFAHDDFSFRSLVVAGDYAFLPLLRKAKSFIFLPRQKYGLVAESEVQLTGLSFRPPETILNLQRPESVDPRKNDVWACGVFVYWIATGKMPFGETDEETLVVYSEWSRYSFEVVAQVIEHMIDGLEVDIKIKSVLYRTLTLRPASRASVRDLLAEAAFAEVEPLAKSQPNTDFLLSDFLDKLPAAPLPSPGASLLLVNQETGYNISVTAGLAAQILGRVPRSTPEYVLAANVIAAEFTQSLRDLEMVQFAVERLGRRKGAVLAAREEIMQLLRYDIWHGFAEMYVGMLDSGEEQGRVCSLLTLARLLDTASSSPREAYKSARSRQVIRRASFDQLQPQSAKRVAEELISAFQQ